jgi:hypothetical protein
VQIGYPLYENGVISTDSCIYYQTLYNGNNIAYNDHIGYYADCIISNSVLGDDLYLKDKVRTYELQNM